MREWVLRTKDTVPPAAATVDLAPAQRPFARRVAAPVTPDRIRTMVRERSRRQTPDYAPRPR